MSNKINPLTGKDMGGKINPLTGLPLTTKSSAITPFSGMYVGAGDYSSYDRYGVQVDPWSDMNEMRAERQTELEKWKNGLAKAGITAVGATLENTIGTVLGLGDYVLSGFDDFDQSMSENPIGKIFDEVNEWAQENLPNYYTEEEQRKQGTLASLGTANFWADKFANGAAYSLGSIASMYLTGGYGLVGGVTKLTGAAGKMSSALASYNAAKTIKAGKTLKDALGSARSGKATAMRIGKAAQMAEAGMMMSMAEAAVEARETNKVVRDKLIEEAKKRKFRTAKVDLNAVTKENFQVNSWEDVQLDAQELQQIELQAQQAEGAAFYGNMAVLAPSNLFLFGKSITPFSSATKATNKIVSTTAEGGKKAFVDIAETLPKYLQKPYKVGRAVAPYAEGAVTEGFQEGAQYAISQGIEEYEAKKFADSGSGELVSSMLNAGMFKDTKALMEASPDIAKRGVESFSEAEGREQMLIGAMVGLLSRGRSGFQEYTTKEENTKKITNLLNNERFYQLATRAENLNQAIAISNSMDQALEDGDKTAYELLQGDLLANEILTHINHGSLDMFIERMQDAKQLEDVEFKKLFRIDPQAEVNKNEIVDGILNQVETIKTGQEVINTLFPSTETYGLPRLLMGEERRKAEQEKLRDQEIYKNTLLRSYSRLSTIDEKVNEALRNLTSEDIISKRYRNRLQRYKRTKFGDVTVDLAGEEKASLRQGEKLQDTLEKIDQDITAKEEDGTLDPVQARIARQELAALNQLIQFRNTAALAFDNLVTNPKERDLAVSRAKAKAKQAENQLIYDNLVNNTDTSDELSARLENETLPTELESSIEDEVIKRQEEEVSFTGELDYLSLDELKAKKAEDLTGLQKKTLDAYIKEREEKGEVEPRVKKPSKKATDKARERAAQKKPKKQDTQSKPQDTTRPPDDTDDTDGPEGPSSPSGPVDNPPPANPGGSSGSNSGEPRSQTVTSRKDDSGLSDGEFVIDNNGRIVVTDNGEFIDSNNLDVYESGEPIITDEGRALLRDPNLIAGVQVEARVVENSWWKNKMETDALNAMANMTSDIPIFLFYNGVAVAKIAGGNNKLRQKVVEEYRKKESDRQPVTTEITAKKSNNPIYLRTEDGRPFYSNAFEVYGDVPVGIVSYDVDTDSKVVRIGNVKSGSEASITNEISTELSELIESSPIGQVFFVYTDPNGRKRIHRAHTATLSDSEVETALQLMADNKSEELQALVGMNSLDAELLADYPGNYMRINPSPYQGVYSYEFNIPSLLGKYKIKGAESNFMVSIQSNLLKVLLDPNTDISKLVEELTKEDWVERDKDKKIVSQGKWYGVRNRLIKYSAVVEGRTRYKSIGGSILSENEYFERFLKDLVPEIRASLKNKRRQVSIDDLLNNPKYFEKLANTPHEKTGEFEGYAGVISTDGTKVFGNHVRDIELGFSLNRISVGGNAVEEVSPSPRPPKASTQPTQPTQGKEPDFTPKQKEPDFSEATKMKFALDANGDMVLDENGNPVLVPVESTTTPSTGQELDDQLNKLEGEIDSLQDDLAEARPEDVATIAQYMDRAKAQWKELTGLDFPNRVASPDSNDSNPAGKSEDDAPFRAQEDKGEYTKMDRDRAIAWLKSRGIPVEIYDTIINVGGKIGHGYMKNATVYLWKNAEVGTEYHEAYHYVFRTLLDDKQRKALYDEARKRFNQPNATELELEELMAEDFRDYVFTSEETAKTLPQKIRKFFKDLMNYIKALIRHDVQIEQLYSMIEANKFPRKYERNKEQFAPDQTAYRLVDTAADAKTNKDTILTVVGHFENELQLFEQELQERIDAGDLQLRDAEKARLEHINDLLGTPGETKGKLAEYYLKRSVSINGRALTNERIEFASSTGVTSKADDISEVTKDNRPITTYLRWKDYLLDDSLRVPKDKVTVQNLEALILANRIIDYTSLATDEEIKENFEILEKLKTATIAEVKELEKQIKGFNKVDWDEDVRLGLLEDLTKEALEAYRKTTATPTKDTVLGHLMRLIDANDKEGMKELAKLTGLKNTPPIDLDLPEGVFSSEQQMQTTAKMFWRLYANWDDVVEAGTENVTKYGWREAVLQELKRFGYSIKSRLIEDNTLDGTEEELEENKVTYDKIYNISSFEVSPTTKFSEEVKRFFTKMVGTSPNALGYHSPVDIQQTIRYTLAAAYGKPTLKEMIRAINSSAENLPILQPVAQYLNHSLKGNEAAAFKSYLSLDYTDHRIFEIESQTMGNKTSRVFKIIKADSKSAARQLLYDWKREGKSDLFERPEALYKIIRIQGKDGELGEGKFTVNNAVIDGKSREQHIADGFKQFNSGKTEAEKIEGINKVLWYMSIRFGPSIESSARRLVQHINDFPQAERAQEIEQLAGRSRALAKKAFTLETFGKEVRSVKAKEAPEDIFSDNDSRLRTLSEIGAKFELPIATSFVDPRGKTIYPYNLPTPFNDYMREFAADESGELYQQLSQDKFITADGNVEHSSMLYRLLNRNKDILNDFEVRSFTMSVFREAEDELSDNDYTNLSPRDAFILKMNTYAFGGTKSAYYPISIQEDRPRMDFMKLPKWSNKASLDQARLGGKTRQGIIEDIIIRDLIKIAQESNNSADGAPQFHLTGIKDEVVKGARLSKQIMFALNNPEHKASIATRQKISEMAKNYLDTTFVEYTNRLGKRLNAYNIVDIDPKDKKVSWHKSTKLSDDVTRQDPVEFIREYAFNDMVARIEMGTVFRNGTTQYKSLTEYYKRNGLINTPGNKMLIQGEFEGDPDYGMFREFNEATVQDFRLSDPEHDRIAKDYKKAIKKSLLDRGYSEELAEKEAEDTAKQYRISFGADITDAQGFISPEMERRMQMGDGKWTEKDEEMYQRYLKGAPWEGYLAPRKNYYENTKVVDGKRVVEMDKNSYVILTREMAQNSDILKDMYDRMMSQGAYQGMKPIHLINVVSAKKGFKKQDKDSAFKVDQQSTEPKFNGLKTNVQKGDKLYKPQTINYSEKELAAMNRQIRKNLLSMVQDNYSYTLNGKKVTGKQLKDRYYEALDKLLEENEKKLEQQLGYDELRKDFTNKENRLKFLQNVRRVIIDSALKNDTLDDNTEKQLQIVEDLSGDLDFSLPLQTTMYQRKFERLFFSLYRNNVYRIELPGRELVQVASPGKFTIGEGTTQTTSKKDGVDELFKNNPELAAIGTPEQYSAYLDSIFPDSKVKDIVYHGVVKGRKAYNNILEKGFNFKTPRNWDTSKSKFLEDDNTGMFFSDFATALDYGIDLTYELNEKGEYEPVGYNNVIAALLNVDYLDSSKETSSETAAKFFRENKNKPNIGMFGPEGGSEGVHDNYVVFEKEQIHILGSKKDIAGFKEFAKGGAQQRELRYLDVSKDGKTLKHAEVMISEDLAERLGVKIGDTGISYRIPHQGYSSTLGVKIVGLLPKGYSKSIVVPGNIVIQTGSDFDIDKLFTLFRDNSDSPIAQYRNEIIDIMETITLSSNHIAETLRPLDQEELNKLADEYGGELSLEFDDPTTEITVMSNFQASRTLVGRYANGLAGLSVAVHGQSSSDPNRTGIRINANRHFTINGVELTDISQFSKLTGLPTSAGMIKRLSAALDAGKKMIHNALNDNAETVNTTIFLESIGVDEATIVALLNTPLVREFVSKRRLSPQSSIRNLFQKMAAQNGIRDFNNIADNKENAAKPTPMTTEELKEIVKSKDKSSEKARAVFRNFIIAYYAGKDLVKDYKTITPDTVDGMGDLAEIEAYLGGLDRYRRAGNKSTISYQDIQSILIGDAYPPSRSFYQRIYNSMELASELFLGPTDAVRGFKAAFQTLTGKEEMTAKEHRTLDRALSYYMITKEGSPLADLLTVENAKKYLLQRDKNIFTGIKSMMKTVPSLKSNLFLSRVKEGNGFNDENADVFTIMIDNVEKLSPLEREQQKRDLLNLIESPEIYTPDTDLQKKIKNMGEAIIFNSIVTTGLAPTYGAYYEAIPFEYFFGIQKDGVTLGEFIRAEVKEAKSNPEYFLEAMGPIIRNYGVRKSEGNTLIPTVSKLPQTASDFESAPQFIVKADNKKKRDKYSIYQKTAVGYRQLQHMSIGGKILEMNLRDENGEITESSMFTAFTNAKPRREGLTKVDPTALSNIKVELEVASNQVKEERSQLKKCK